ncbi:MAG: hypothetical protein AAGK79_13320 [Pseudomonadota bacterium]
MMHTLTSAMIGGGFAIGLAGGVALLPERPQPFMTVHSMVYSDGRVHADRTFFAPSRVADWAVTIVSEVDDPPSCNTIKGLGLHQGWSRYSPGRNASDFSLNEWVNDPGCLERLTPGLYSMYVTWTPRDGSPPVTESAKITISP